MWNMKFLTYLYFQVGVAAVFAMFLERYGGADHIDGHTEQRFDEDLSQGGALFENPTQSMGGAVLVRAIEMENAGRHAATNDQCHGEPCEEIGLVAVVIAVP